MLSDDTFTLPLADEAATAALAAKLAASLAHLAEAVRESGFNLRLDGNLGAGKTTFTRAFLRALGFQGRVKSPTFELVEDYDLPGGLILHHFDFYRFEDPEEFDDAGFRDLFGAGQIVFSEWSEKAAPCLPAADLVLHLTVTDAMSREATLHAASPLGRQVQEDLR